MHLKSLRTVSAFICKQRSEGKLRVSIEAKIEHFLSIFLLAVPVTGSEETTKKFPQGLGQKKEGKGNGFPV
jgi:hypothetical protein